MASPLAELKQAAIVNTLRGCQLFAGLAPEDLNAIAAITVVKSLDKGDYLFREGAPAQGFYIAQKGAINVHRVNAAGKEQVIHVFRAGESFAEAALATSSGYPADARALESSQVLLVEKAGFLALLAAPARAGAADARLDEPPFAHADRAARGHDVKGRGDAAGELADQALPQPGIDPTGRHRTQDHQAGAGGRAGDGQ